MPTAEDNYRIEVWDGDGRELIETISRSPEDAVSIAAWHVAVRLRPGRLLIHKNADRTMTRMLAPGEPDSDVRRPLRLGDLRSWHQLRAWCYACRNHRYLGVDDLARRVGAETTIDAVEAKLRCRRCGDGPVQLQIFSAERGDWKTGAARED